MPIRAFLINCDSAAASKSQSQSALDDGQPAGKAGCCGTSPRACRIFHYEREGSMVNRTASILALAMASAVVALAQLPAAKSESASAQAEVKPVRAEVLVLGT